MSNHALTPQEITMVELMGEWWNAFCLLPQTHPSDASDVLFHVHALQRIIMTRLAQRSHPEHFPLRRIYWGTPGEPPIEDPET